MDTTQASTRRMGLLALGLVLLSAIIIVSLLRDRIVNQPWREVSVVGTGKIAYDPDVARILLGVHVEGASAEAALSELTTKVGAVIPALEALGVDPENIATQNLNVYPQYYYPSEAPSAISGYTADQQLMVEVAIASSTDMVGRVIQTASAAGANQVLNVSFEASNVDDLRQEALLEAIADARERADEISEATGVKLGKVVNWWENSAHMPGELYAQEGYGGNKGGGMFVPAGTYEVVVQVNLNYETK